MATYNKQEFRTRGDKPKEESWYCPSRIAALVPIGFTILSKREGEISLEPRAVSCSTLATEALIEAGARVGKIGIQEHNQGSPRRSRKRPAQYQERLFAFTDILGFGELVQATQSDAIQVSKLKDALEQVLVYAEKPVNLRGNVKGVAFSDSIVLSEQNSLRGLLNVLVNLALLS